MTPNDIIQHTRRIIQDNQLLRSTEEYIDASLLDYVNQTIRQTCVLRPDLFTMTDEFATTPNVVEQATPSDSKRLVEIFSVRDGGAVTEVSRETMDRSSPGWTQAPAGQPVNWMRNIRNPNRYFLYPRPVEGVFMVGDYIQSPPVYTLNQNILLLGDSYLPVVSYGVVSMVFGAQGPSNNVEVANSYQERYSSMLGLSVQSRVITDTRESGLDPRQVI